MKKSKILKSEILKRRAIKEICMEAVEKALQDLDLTAEDENRLWLAGTNPIESITRKIKSGLIDLTDYEHQLRYPDNYKVKQTEEQVEILRTLGFPVNQAPLNKTVPFYPAEGFFVLPTWKFVPSSCKNPHQYALAFMYERFQSVTDNWWPTKDKLEFDNIITSAKYDSFWYIKSKSNFVILAAQLGRRHKGINIIEAEKKFLPGEITLTPYEVGCMILTHPERIKGSGGTLKIACKNPSDETGMFIVDNWSGFDNVTQGYVAKNFGVATCFSINPTTTVFPE